MLTAPKQQEVLDKLRALRGTPEGRAVPVLDAYRQLYPDQVQEGDFRQCWQAVLEEERDQQSAVSDQPAPAGDQPPAEPAPAEPAPAAPAKPARKKADPPQS